MKFKDLANYSPALARYGIGIVFLLLGLDQILNPSNWIAWFPSWIYSTGIEIQTAVVLNGIFDITIGLFLIAGLFTRLFAGLASIHLTGIIFNLGYNDIAIRDLGLLLVSIAVFIHGADRLCLDKKLRGK